MWSSSSPSSSQAGPLGRAFYDRDPVTVARDLLGAVLVHETATGDTIAGRIVETEAYWGEADLACHAARGRTPRTATMYGPPGHAYVYLIYGMHDMLNAVVGAEGDPSAVLIRAVAPIVGIARPTNGPGRVTRAFGITRSLNGADLTTGNTRIVPGDSPQHIGVSPRIGVDYAGEWAARPWRFFDADSPHVSGPPKAKPGVSSPDEVPSSV